jgi:hypothetical protein
VQSALVESEDIVVLVTVMNRIILFGLLLKQKKCYGEEWYLSFIKTLSVSMKERIIPMLSV